MPRKKKLTPPALDFIAPAATTEPEADTATRIMAEVITPDGTVAGTFTLESHGDRFAELAAEYAARKGYTVR